MEPVPLFWFPETGRSVIHDLQSEVSGDYGKALLILAEVPEAFTGAVVDCVGGRLESEGKGQKLKGRRKRNGNVSVL